MDGTRQHPEELDSRDAGGIVLGWLTKVALVAAIIGVIGFDGINVGLAHLNTVDDGGNAAQAASQKYETTHDINLAFAAARAAVNSHEVVDQAGFSIDPDGTAHLTLTNTIHTLLLYRTKQTEKWAEITVKVSGKYTGS